MATKKHNDSWRGRLLTQGLRGTRIKLLFQLLALFGTKMHEGTAQREADCAADDDEKNNM